MKKYFWCLAPALLLSVTMISGCAHVRQACGGGCGDGCCDDGCGGACQMSMSQTGQTDGGSVPATAFQNAASAAGTPAMTVSAPAVPATEVR